MLVFIDESGDPGFRLTKGSSPVFVTSMIIFADVRAAQETSRKITDLRAELGIKPEFKFNKCKSVFRDRFFDEIGPCPFSARFVVVRKKLIYSPALKSVKESFYKFFVRMMMRHDGGALQNAKVVIDGSGDRLFKKQLRAYIRHHIPRDCVARVDLRDSARDPLIQLADMAAGAVARSYHDERKESGRWRAKLQRSGRISNIWEFR